MVAQTATLSSQRSSKTGERVFYTGMAVAILITVFAGFSRTFYLRPHFQQIQPLIPLLIVHGIVFSSWIVLLIVQTSLVAAKRTRTHMRLGIAGGVLAAAMIVIGTVTAIITVTYRSSRGGYVWDKFVTATYCYRSARANRFSLGP